MLQGGFRAAREGKSVQVPGAVPAGDTARPGLNLNLDSEVGTDSFRVCFHLTRETCASIYDGGLGFLRERPGGPSRSVGPTFATGGLLLQGGKRATKAPKRTSPLLLSARRLLQGGKKTKPRNGRVRRSCRADVCYRGAFATGGEKDHQSPETGESPVRVGPTFATGGLLLQGTRVRSLDSGSARRPTFATGGLLLQGGYLF